MWIFFGATFQRKSIVLPAAIHHPSLLRPSLQRKQTSLPWFQKETTMKRKCNHDHRKKFPPGSMKSRHLLFHFPKSLTLSLSSNHAIPHRGVRDLLQSREHLLHLRSTASSESPSRAQRGAAASPLPPSAGQRAPPPSPRPPATATTWPATTRSYRPTPPTSTPRCYHAEAAAYPDLGPGPIYEGCLVSVVLPLPRWFTGRKKPQQ